MTKHAFMQSVQAQRIQRQFDATGSEGAARPFVDDEGVERSSFLSWSLLPPAETITLAGEAIWRQECEELV